MRPLAMMGEVQCSTVPPTAVPTKRFTPVSASHARRIPSPAAPNDQTIESVEPFALVLLEIGPPEPPEVAHHAKESCPVLLTLRTEKSPLEHPLNVVCAPTYVPCAVVYAKSVP